MPGPSTTELGRWGEDAACAFLKLKGLEILERNYRVGRLELDIIAEDREEIVFVEVKLRSRGDFGGPWGAVGFKKRKDLVRAAASYLARARSALQACRFDVVGVEVDEGAVEMRLTHVERAFDAST